MRFYRLTIFLLFSLLPVLCATSAGAANKGLLVDDFQHGFRPGWQTKIFSGETSYTPMVQDGIPCIHADSRGSASGMIYKIKFDPSEYPILDWRWKIDNIIKKGDARTKAGDDYPARIYVAFPAIFFWNTKVLNYVWSNKLPVGAAVKSSYSSNFAMISVENGSKQLGKWREYKMNIYEDYIKNFGHIPPDAGAVAIMTDTDNTNESASACYGPIRLFPAK